jgi:acylphosphatase
VVFHLNGKILSFSVPPARLERKAPPPKVGDKVTWQKGADPAVPAGTPGRVKKVLTNGEVEVVFPDYRYPNGGRSLSFTIPHARLERYIPPKPLIPGEEVTWTGADKDVPKGTVGRVSKNLPDGEVEVVFPGTGGRLFVFAMPQTRLSRHVPTAATTASDKSDKMADKKKEKSFWGRQRRDKADPASSQPTPPSIVPPSPLDGWLELSVSWRKKRGWSPQAIMKGQFERRFFLVDSDASVLTHSSKVYLSHLRRDVVSTQSTQNINVEALNS